MSSEPLMPSEPPPFCELDGYVFGFAHPGSQLKDHIYEHSRRLFAAGDAQRDALRSTEAVVARQAKIRADLLESLGGLPTSASPLNPRVTGVVQGAGFTVEKIIFESRPSHYVTANLYLPDGLTAPTAAVLFLCGHHIPAKQQPEYQGVCQALVAAGLVVLALDPVGQGERLSYYDPATQRTTVPAGTRDHDTAGAQCRFLGDSIARYFLHDAMRGIDYLMTRAEVDPRRIGVTGNSGGGTQTSLVMMVDPRIAAAAPGTFVMTRDSYQRTGQPQDAEQIWPGFTRGGYDHEDILLAMAPKPVCVLAVTADFFPIEGTRRTVDRARRVWSLFDHADRLELVEDQATHAYTPVLAAGAARFFARHLLGREADPGVFSATPFPMEKLQCTASGQVRAEFSDAQFVFDANHARWQAAERSRAALPAAERKKRALDWLRAEVFRDRETVDLNPRVIERGRTAGGCIADIAFWWPQPHLANLGMLFRARAASAAAPVTVAVWDDGTAALSRHAVWLQRECAVGRAVWVVNLSGVGPLQPDAINGGGMREFYGTWHKLADDLDWIGDSLVALRTYEVIRALDALSEWPELVTTDLRIHGHGRMGIHGKLAAALDPRVMACAWDEGFLFRDFVQSRVYDTQGVKELILPAALQHLELDEI